MIREAITKIHDLALKADGRTTFSIPNEPDHRYGVIAPDGAVEVRTAEPHPRKHKAADLTAIAAFAGERLEESEVWYSREAVTVFLISLQRRDRVDLPLSFSPQMKVLQDYERTRTGQPQKAFIHAMRVHLDGTHDGTVLAAIRNVKFTSGGVTEGRHAQGKASIGKKLEAEMEGADRVPETIILNVPVFHGFLPAATFPVRCALDVDPTAETFTLQPYPGEIETAIRAAEDMIGSRLQTLLPDYKALYFGKS